MNKPRSGTTLTSGAEGLTARTARALFEQGPPAVNVLDQVPLGAEPLEWLERSALRAAIWRARGVQRLAAEILRVHPIKVHRLLRRHWPRGIEE